MQHGFEKLSADEIRIKLTSYGVSPEEAKGIKGKSALVDRLRELIALDNEKMDFDTLTSDVDVPKEGINLEVFGTAIEATVAAEAAEPPPSRRVVTQNDLDDDPPAIPHPTDTGWSEHVLTLFAEDELVEGNPTVDGLFRVTQKLRGPIQRTTSRVVSPPSKEGFLQNAVVEASILFESGHEFSGCADVFLGNTAEPYCRHPVGTCETKAFGRALRRALGLKKVLAAEEVVVGREEGEDDRWNPDARCTKEQKFALDLLCKNCDIDVMKFVNSGKGRYSSLDDVPFKIAREMLEYVHEFVNKKIEVPAKLKGYNAEYDRGEI